MLEPIGAILASNTPAAAAYGVLASDLTGYNRYWGAVAAANVSAYNGSTNIFNLLTYGGVGDDTTDNSIAISNWLNAATLAKGRAYFPAGIYRFTNAGFNQ